MKDWCVSYTIYNCYSVYTGINIIESIEIISILFIRSGLFNIVVDEVFIISV